MTPRAWKRLFARVLLWGGMIVGGVLLFFLIQETWHVYGKEREAAKQHAHEAQSLTELNARKVVLAAELKRLNTPEGIDTEIRQRYPVAKSGEEVIVLTNNPNAPSPPPTPKPSLWQRFIDWFSW